MEIIGTLTAGQVSVILGFIPVFVAWLYSELLELSKNSNFLKFGRKNSQNLGDLDARYAKIPLLHEGPSEISNQVKTSASFTRCLSFDKDFLLENRATLRAIVEFGSLINYFYLCDRTDLFGESQKSYSRGLFFFLYFLLVIVATMTSLRNHQENSQIVGKKIQYLNRDQTEEWKGWMQVLFIMYHYFNAKEIYNAIRIFIACYVWMTGFGNFSYYYVRKDFNFSRFAQMLWRINFFVAFLCITLNNHYMMYYICPMHTFFTVMVYGALGLFKNYNGKGWVIATKIISCFVIIIVVWEIPNVFDFLWSPFSFLLAYNDPDSSTQYAPMHEWQFRSGLDRYIWIIGMIFAYFHPTVERWIEKLEKTEEKSRVFIKTLIVTICLVAGSLWYKYIYTLEKYTYNMYHPYTSWIPITIYIILRNINQQFRNYTITLFGWLGKITLETYLSQYHIWLSHANCRSGGPDKQPRKLLSLIPDYPLLNFMLTTVIYIMVARRIFQLTNKLKTVFIPSNDNKQVAYNVIMGIIVSLILYALSLLILGFPNILHLKT